MKAIMMYPSRDVLLIEDEQDPRVGRVLNLRENKLYPPNMVLSIIRFMPYFEDLEPALEMKEPEGLEVDDGDEAWNESLKQRLINFYGVRNPNV